MVVSYERLHNHGLLLLLFSQPEKETQPREPPEHPRGRRDLSSGIFGQIPAFFTFPLSLFSLPICPQTCALAWHVSISLALSFSWSSFRPSPYCSQNFSTPRNSWQPQTGEPRGGVHTDRVNDNALPGSLPAL